MLRYKQLLLLAVVAVFSVIWPMNAVAESGVEDIYELTLEKNLNTPLPDNDKATQRIADIQSKLCNWLKEKKFKSVLTRFDNGVICVTVAASKLFEPNSVELSAEGKKLLTPVLQVLNVAGLYKVLLVMHSDDTGSKSYAVALTTDRVNSIFDWMEIAKSTDFVVPYAMGSSSPIDGVDNHSLKNRELNRRLEIFIVPEEGMLALAKKEDLSLKTLKIK